MLRIVELKEIIFLIYSFCSLNTRPLQNVQFRSRLRKTKTLTTDIHWVFRGLKFESDLKIGQKRVFFKGLYLAIKWRTAPSRPSRVSSNIGKICPMVEMVGVRGHICENTGFIQTQWGNIRAKNFNCSMLGFPLLSSTWMEPSAAISS